MACQTSDSQSEGSIPELNEDDLSFLTLDVSQRVGGGASGRVYRASYRGESTAIKILHPNRCRREPIPLSFIDEANIMYRCCHSNLVRAVAIAQVPPMFCGLPTRRYTWGLIMELMEGGSLADLIKDQKNAACKILYSDDDAYNWCLGIAEALHYLHTQPGPVIHRDVKPDNILLTSIPTRDRACAGGGAGLVAKLSDFGIHVVLDPNRGTFFAGRASCASSHLSAKDSLGWQSPSLVGKKALLPTRNHDLPPVALPDGNRPKDGAYTSLESGSKGLSSPLSSSRRASVPSVTHARAFPPAEAAAMEVDPEQILGQSYRRFSSPGTSTGVNNKQLPKSNSRLGIEPRMSKCSSDRFRQSSPVSVPSEVRLRSRLGPDAASEEMIPLGADWRPEHSMASPSSGSLVDAKMDDMRMKGQLKDMCATTLMQNMSSSDLKDSSNNHPPLGHALSGGRVSRCLENPFLHVGEMAKEGNTITTWKSLESPNAKVPKLNRRSSMSLRARSGQAEYTHSTPFTGTKQELNSKLSRESGSSCNQAISGVDTATPEHSFSGPCNGPQQMLHLKGRTSISRISSNLSAASLEQCSITSCGAAMEKVSNPTNKSRFSSEGNMSFHLKSATELVPRASAAASLLAALNRQGLAVSNSCNGKSSAQAALKPVLSRASSGAYMGNECKFHTPHTSFTSRLSGRPSFRAGSFSSVMTDGWSHEEGMETVYNLTGNQGTHIYMAPEVIEERPYNEKCDVYSFGVVMLELYSRSLLKEVLTAKDIEMIGSPKHRSRLSLVRMVRMPGHVEKGILDIINMCLQEDPGIRITISQAVEALKVLRMVDDELLGTKNQLHTVFSADEDDCHPVNFPSTYPSPGVPNLAEENDENHLKPIGGQGHLSCQPLHNQQEQPSCCGSCVIC